MKLSFLGKSYDASNPAVEASLTEDTITFLGCRSKVKAYSVTQNPALGEELYFMGRRYVR